MADNFLYLQAQAFSLAGAGCVIGATSITLKSFETIDGVPITMSMLGDLAFMTLEPGNGIQEEQICFTGVTQNAGGTATLTGVKNVLFESPYTQTSGVSKTHAGSTTAILSNTSGFYDQMTSKDNDETVDGVWSFTQVPNTLQDPVSGDDLARRSWVLSVVNGGPISFNELIINGTAGETVVAGNLLYLKASDGRWWKTDADTAATVENVPLGIAQGAGTAGNLISDGVLINGLDSNQSGLTPNTVYYASNTAGGLSSTPGTKEVTIGVAISASTINFFPRYNQQITEDEQDAMSGGGSLGTPSASNKFLTENKVASTTVSGIVEEATLSEVDLGTAAGGTSARLFQNTNVVSSYLAGVGPSTVAKTYFNIQMPIILWTGEVADDTETSFINWVTSSITDATPTQGGAMATFQSAGTAHLAIDNGFVTSATTDLQLNSTNIIIMDFWAKLPASSTGDIQMGFSGSVSDLEQTYNSTTGNRVTFAQSAAGVLYATIAKNTVGNTATDISSGVTTTNWNNYRIELDLSNNALFYVNGVLKATLSGANFPNGAVALALGYGRSGDADFAITAPNISLQMNP